MEDSGNWSQKEHENFGNDMLKLVSQLMADGADGVPLRDAYFRAFLKTGNHCILA